VRILFLGGTGNISTACVDLALARGHQVEAAVAAFAGRTGQYVFTGTAAAYDKRAARLPITEDAPLANPFWEYARLKIACEAAVRRAHEDGRLAATIVRPSYTYGPTWIPSGFGGQDYTVVDRMRRGRPVLCHGDGTALWVMTHASDFATGFLGLLGHPGALGEAVHVTSDEVLTWDAIYETIARAAGAAARLVHVPSALVAALVPDKGGSLLGDKSLSSTFDNTKIRGLVPDFQPKVGFAEGMAQSVAWFDADPARRAVNPAANEAIDRVLRAWGRAWEGLPGDGPR
jgi:nucleoside-diphosphate-sugar epimerase